MPGTKKENISLEVDGNIIRIGVSEDEGVTEESESPDKKWHRSRGGSFIRFRVALRMPENTDFSKIESKYENGTLQIDVKKQPTPKHPEPKKISIKWRCISNALSSTPRGAPATKRETTQRFTKAFLSIPWKYLRNVSTGEPSNPRTHARPSPQNPLFAV